MVRLAARVGHTFGIDPIVVLKSDMFDLALRTAAFNVVQEDERRKAEQAKKGSSK